MSIFGSETKRAATRGAIASLRHAPETRRRYVEQGIALALIHEAMRSDLTLGEARAFAIEQCGMSAKSFETAATYLPQAVREAA